MTQVRYYLVAAIISAFVATCLLWPAGRASHAALLLTNESAKTSQPQMPLARVASDEPSWLHQPNGKFTFLSRGGGHESSSIQTGATVQLSAANYSAGEGDQRITLSVTRSGDTSGPATVTLTTSDLAGSPNCNAATGMASSRCDYETSIGTVKFAAGQASKSVSVSIVDDAYLEGPETFTVSLTNPSGATSGSPGTATVTIADNDAANGASPIFTASFFVPIHYLDFLNREPDQSGLNFWLNEISSCGADQQCTEVKRINVSAAFYLSIEFQQTGYLVERIYKAAYGDANGISTLNGSHQLGVPIIRLNEFLADTQEIGRDVVVNQSGWEQVLENNKLAFIAAFAQRSRFTTALPASLTPTQFVDTLNSNANNPLSASERTQLVTDLTNSDKTRAQVLRIIAEHQNLVNAEFNRAFVLMQYFGYLRRNPDDLQDTDYTGYDFWLTKLNQFGGNFINAEMVKAFITSTEYRNRFGGAATPTPTPTPSLLTPEQRFAAVEAVRIQFQILKTGPNQNTVNQELLNFILSRPEFAEAGISTDSCVWATYTDGVQLIVINNRDPDPPGSSSPAPRPAVARSVSKDPRPQNLPDSANANLIFALHGGGYSNAIPDIRTWMNEANYREPFGSGATVEALKTVGGDGVFFYDGHGGTSTTDIGPAFVLTTETAQSPANDRALVADLYTSTDPASLGRVRLNYAIVNNGLTPFSAKTVYAITEEFIRFYWGRFSPSSFVFINACSSSSDGAAGFKFAIKQKGASVYAGWTEPVGNLKSYNTAQFVFDRLLGANKIYSESDGFKTRAFNYESVADDLVKHNLGHDSDTGAELVFTPFAGNGDFQMLAPSIWFMEVDLFFNVLTIHGEFGDDPGASNRGVTVGGQSCNVHSWSKDHILLDLPLSGAGSSGEVIVTVRQQKSNTAHLTEWEGDFTHTVTGQGSLKQSAIYHVRIRADIRLVRNQIHGVPNLIADRAVGATEDSGYSYECSGEFSETLPVSPPQVCTEKWSGSGSLPRLPLLQTGNGIRAIGFISNTKLTFQLSVSAGSARVVNLGCTPPGGSTDTPKSLISPKVGNNGTFVANLNSNFAIVGNTLNVTDINGLVHKLTWNLIAPKSGTAPQPNSAR